MESGNYFEFHNITKNFPGVKALSDVSFAIKNIPPVVPAYSSPSKIVFNSSLLTKATGARNFLPLKLISTNVFGLLLYKANALRYGDSKRCSCLIIKD